MRHHRLRIILLSLGVLFGFGSAFAHGHHHCRHDDDRYDHGHAGHWEWHEDHP